MRCKGGAEREAALPDTAVGCGLKLRGQASNDLSDESGLG